MQPIASGAKYAAYQARLRGSHDFSVDVDILSLDEVHVGTATMLDGQVNIGGQSNPLVRRGASMTLSDPAGALDFSDSSAWSDTGIWVDRLVRVRHTIVVEPYGEMTATVGVFVPRGLSRQGSEVQVTLEDKAALANRGAKPLTVYKGENAVKAIRRIMATCTGEFRFRMPAHSRKLSQRYAVGLADDAAPMVVAAKIARQELDQTLFYSCDGYLTLRPTPNASVADMGYVTDQASTSVDFSTIANYVKVSGHQKSKTKNHVTTTSQPVSTIETKPGSSVSKSRIKRQGVERWLPLVINEDGYTKTKQTARRAKTEIDKASGVTSNVSASVIPMFHLDWNDLVRVRFGEADNDFRFMRLTEASIPLGVGGDMTIGFHRWVSSKAFAHAKSQVVHTRHRHKKKKRRRRK